MARILANLVQAALAEDIDAVNTTVKFTAPLREYGTTNLPTIAAPDTLTLRVGFELLHVTAYTAGATSATVARGAEGSTATAHNAGDMARHVSTDADFAGGDLAAHEADTTNVHGIVDTAALYRSGGTDVAVTDGGTGASNAATARTNLGVDAAISAAIAALVDSSPAALDTLNELADALGDDPNFATTINNALAEKVAASTLTTDDDLLTRAAGVPARLTRSALAAAPAFSGTYLPLTGLGPVRTVLDASAISGQTIGTANRAVYLRCWQEATISKVALQVTVQAGNICVAVYAPDGTNEAPGTRKATSGSVACPAVGYAEVSLGASVDFEVGDYLFVSTDDATFALYANTTSLAVSNVLTGFAYFQDSAFPAPAAPSPTPGVIRNPYLLGVA